MLKSTIVLALFISLQLFHVSLSKNLSNSGSLASGPRNKRGGKGKKKFDPKELEKPLLDENSLEEDYAERMIVYKNGRKSKPKNINRKPKHSQLAERMDKHPARPRRLPQAPPSRKKRVFVAEENVKWPNRVIPYEINTASYGNAASINAVFAEAVSKFNAAGCVRWVPRTSEANYVTVFGDVATCSSYVGPLGISAQPLRLYEFGCVYVDTALHEMLHAAGAMHEQSRQADRDKIITYNWDPISSGAELNYEGYILTNARKYDLSSVLQYGLWYGSSRVMYANDPDLEYLTTITQGDLSFYDKAELNAFYTCADGCTNPPVCQNEGFVKQSGGVCSCECVDGLTGTDCTELDTSPGCGGFIDLATGASQPITMSPYQAGLKCTWLVKGPAKTKIHVMVDSLGLPTSSNGNCYHYLEIRDYLSGADGKLICGNSGGGEFTKMNLGPTNMMVIRFDSDQYNTVSPGSGFSLTVTAKPSACSSSPCKYPATCEDGATVDDYTCTCTAGYSGVNCDTVAASASVTDSFEDDFTTLMQPVTVGTDFYWMTRKYDTMNGAQITASDGSLMAAMEVYFFNTPFYYAYIAKMETSATFERGERCLRFDYAISDSNVGGAYVTSLTIKVLSDSGTTDHVYNTNTGNAWTTAEIDLPAIDNMKIEIQCYFGYQQLAIDNIRISPLFCNAADPCDGIVCQNGGACEVTSSTTFQCNCQDGYTGEFCENDVCSGNTCVNGVCNPTSSSTYVCQCDSGWFGTNCETNPCAGVNCNNGVCESLSEAETQCNCNPGWYGQACNVDPCASVNCNNGVCVPLSETQTQCDCDEGWSGTACDVQDVTYTCNFETSVEPNCFLVESTNDNYDFTRRNGGTPTSRTGPSSAAVGSYYKYTEVTGKSRGSVASLESNVGFSSGTYCLSLSISMYGNHIGSLSILTKEGAAAAVTQTSFNGQQGNFWFTYSRDLSLTPSSKIIIETRKGGRRDRNSRGDIAVDNIVLRMGSCPQ